MHETFRRQPPEPFQPKRISIARPYEAMLSNGLQVVIVEQPNLPLVSFRLLIRTGTSQDPKQMPGLTSMVSGMLDEGTERRSSKQIADEVANLGATLSASSNPDYAAVTASSLSIYADEILELMADVTLHPSFPVNELELSKQNTKQWLIQQRAQPAFLADEAISRVIYGEHPYSIVATTPEAVDSMTQAHLMEFHGSFFVPNNAILLAIGDVRAEGLVRQIEDRFAEWNRGNPPSLQFPMPPVRTERTTHLIDRPGSAQSNIVIGNLAITRTSPDYFPMLLLHTILGANASSRLFMNLRESKGYTYGAYSDLDARLTAGAFRVSAEVRTPVTGDSIEEFFLELDRIRKEKVPDIELGNAKSYLTGVFPIRLETQEALISQFAQIKFYGLPDDYMQTYPDRINSVTSDDIQRVAGQYITPDTAAIVVVGDANAIEDQVKRFSEGIERLDIFGKPKNRRSISIAPDEERPSIEGVWQLDINLLGAEQIATTLTVQKHGEAYSANISSQFGEAELTNLNVNGGDFKAEVLFEMPGQQLSGLITGTFDKTNIEGSISLQTPGMPDLTFSGRRG